MNLMDFPLFRETFSRMKSLMFHQICFILYVLFLLHSYNDEGNDYWSGYFTTRPKLKQAIRRSSRLLRHAEQALAVTSMYNKIDADSRADLFDELNVARYTSVW